MIKETITCKDGMSLYRVEEDGRIRLILMPQDRPILVGQISILQGSPTERQGNAIMLLYKTKSEFWRKSYTLGVPKELFDRFQGVKFVVINTRDTEQYFVVSRPTIELFGYISESDKNSVSDYIFVDFERWKRLSSLDDAIDLAEDRRAEKLLQNYQNTEERKNYNG